MAEEEKVRSMVEGLPVDGSILVPRSGGVRSATSGNSIRAVQIELPALFESVKDSHIESCALKSPPMTKWPVCENKLKISSLVLLPFGA